MPVNPGRLRERIELLMGVEVNTVGGPTTEWDHVDTVWAQVAQVGASGAARYAQAGYSNVTHEVTMRAGPELSLAHTRIRWGQRELQPIAPVMQADHRGRFVTIACREVNDGEKQAAGSSS